MWENGKKKIVLIDDHVVVRNGLKELIEKIGPYAVENEFDSGIDFLEKLEYIPQPDLVVMDLNMPGKSGQEVMEILKERGHEFPVLILTLFGDEDSIIQLFRNGVRGFLMKDCSSDTLKSALEAIFSGGFYHNEFLVMSLQGERKKGRKTEREKILENLTPRETAFLKLVCDEKEYTYEKIALLMNVQHRTVDGYRESLFDKFGVKSKTGLVLFVLKHKLLDDL